MKKLKVFLCVILSVVCIFGTSINSNAYTYKYYNYTKTMYVGDKVKLSPSKYITSNNTTWKSSNTSYATVNKYGYVTAKKSGKVYITATRKSSTSSKRYVYKYTVTIKDSTTYYYYNKSLTVGDNVKFKPSNYVTSKNTIWQSSDTSCATVNKYGYVTAKKTGKVYITATRKSSTSNKRYVYKYTVTIKDKIKYTYETKNVNLVDIRNSKYQIDDGYLIPDRTHIMKNYKIYDSSIIKHYNVSECEFTDEFHSTGKAGSTKVIVTYEDEDNPYHYIVVTYNVTVRTYYTPDEVYNYLTDGNDDTGDSDSWDEISVSGGEDSIYHNGEKCYFVNHGWGRYSDGYSRASQWYIGSKTLNVYTYFDIDN